MDATSFNSGNFISMLKQRFKHADVLMRFVYVNAAIFIVFRIINILLALFNESSFYMLYFELPANLLTFLQRPWSIISYMFLHDDFMHILFNMLWLYGFGQIFMQYLNGKQFTALYLMGGVFGGALYLLAYNIFPLFLSQASNGPVFLLGASASILSIVMGIAFYMPHLRIRLFLFGEMSLRTIALITLAIDILSLTSDNAGGHWAHLGGAAVGALFGYYLNRGVDITSWINTFSSFDGLKVKRPKMRVNYQDVRRETDAQYNERKHKENEDVDRVLEKIKRSGYDSLTTEEKKKLFDASK